MREHFILIMALEIERPFNSVSSPYYLSPQHNNLTFHHLEERK